MPKCACELRLSTRLLRIIQFALVPNGQYSNDPLHWHEPVQDDVARSPERNHQLAQIALDAASDERMIKKGIDTIANGFDRSCRSVRIVLGQIFERALDIVERVTGIDYPRQGLGLAAFGLRASFDIQLWTSSAA